MDGKILVVDDEESIRYTFNAFLADNGYAVTCAASYDEALSQLRENEFDLIYMDIVMDSHTGIDLLKTVRSAQTNVPVIMITGMPSIETAAESLRQGALDYILKPICQATLLRSAEVALRHKALVEEKEKCRLDFQAIFHSVRDGIVMVDENRMVVMINDAASRICGMQRNAVIGKTVHLLPFDCDGTCIKALDEIFINHSHLDVHYIECRNRSKRQQVISLTASPLLSPTDAFSGAVLVLRDETRLVDLERILKESDIIVGKNEAIHKARSLIRDLSDVRTTVLVTGESGTGKELVVDELHRNGERREERLLKINCAALSENLLESELFGHVAGSFTGAVKNNIGRFQLADGGTLFLDEIGDISIRMQLRLLRVLETMEFERVGDAKPIKVDVRVVAATNQDLKEKVARGEFREDLYYRLKVVEIHLPPLRERLDDIPHLVEHFLAIFNRKFNKKIKDVSNDVWTMFNKHAWPGNVRELKNTIEHAFIRCSDSVIALSHLPAEFRVLHRDGDGSAPGQVDQEAEIIRNTLQKARWNKSRAAGMLGISRRTIYRKMQKYGIPFS